MSNDIDLYKIESSPYFVKRRMEAQLSAVRENERKKTLIETARKMFANGLTLEVISKYLDLDIKNFSPQCDKSTITDTTAVNLDDIDAVPNYGPLSNEELVEIRKKEREKILLNIAKKMFADDMTLKVISKYLDYDIDLDTFNSHCNESGIYKIDMDFVNSLPKPSYSTKRLTEAQLEKERKKVYKKVYERERKKWQKVIAEKDALIAEKNALINARLAKLADKDALIAELKKQLGKK